MRAVIHPKASAGQDGANFKSWLSLVAEEARNLFGRQRQTVREAAQTLGRAAAAKRERDNRTLEEIKRDKIAQLRAEREGGWPVPPAVVNRELTR